MTAVAFRFGVTRKSDANVIPFVQRAHFRAPLRVSAEKRHRIRVALTLLALVAAATTGAAVRPASSSYGSVPLAGPAASTGASATATAPTTPLVEQDVAIAARAVPPMPAAARHSAPAPKVASSQNGSGSGSGGGSSSNGTGSTSSSPSGYGCGPALAYLRANAAPGFTLECPGNAYGRQAMTCVNHAPECAGEKIIAIADPCPAAYMNEAHNSWVLTGHGSGIDPYGYCHN